jgi:superfamily I DNA/RNA helicase
MPTIIMTKWAGKLDGSVRSKAMSFLQKLSVDDAAPGLHVEPIHNSVDPRVRTGRVDQFWRAVMFRLDQNGESHYVIQGIWPHDDAISLARKIRLTVNPINGLPQIEEIAPAEAAPTPAPTPTPAPPPAPDPAAEPAPVSAVPAEPLLVQLGRTRADLVDKLGVPDTVADQAMTATDDDAVLKLALQHEGWLGLILVDLTSRDSVGAIVERLELKRPPKPSGDHDDDLLESLRQPAAQSQFSFIGDQDELRRVIEQGDFGAWRVFLHPEQRRYVEKSYSGPFRLSGGAGTGKTVVLVHRARALALRNPNARIVLTTFTTNLADSLRESLAQLDPRIPQTTTLGDPGVYIVGVDALASAVIRSAGSDIAGGVRAVLGDDRSNPNGRAPSARWRSILDTSNTDLLPEVANQTFLTAEYSLVVLPQRVKNEAEYLRVRRPGRGVALDRVKRAALWSLIVAYRAENRIDGTLDFAEAAAVAGAHLEGADGEAQYFADHVLVDEGQDLSPTHWQLLRAIAPAGRDDLFIAEDSHQRIYGPRTVLGRYGIRIVGRSQRLTLNYRTTAQNLRYAMTILDGADYIDLEEQPESTGYRSARSGPVPRVERVHSLGEELDSIAQNLREWIDPETKADTIAVLVHDKFQRERIVNGLTERKIDVRAVDRDKPPPGRVLVMTMHRAKGMEFSKVILADVTLQSPAEKARLEQLDASERHDVELRDRSLVYVAATRARDELAVMQRV